MFYSSYYIYMQIYAYIDIDIYITYVSIYLFIDVLQLLLHLCVNLCI